MDVQIVDGGMIYERSEVIHSMHTYLAFCRAVLHHVKIRPSLSLVNRTWGCRSSTARSLQSANLDSRAPLVLHIAAKLAVVWWTRAGEGAARVPYLSVSLVHRC
jgi:hypothetical protein